ncbi:MAG TPA: TlyA family RNA methyltransferase [Nitrospirota bacterium]|nr:TlyA family RNA methyltransferase [Nitrospirota bacterium]
MKKERQRLDKELLKRGLADTRQRAQGLILSGKVLVDGQRVDKSGAPVGEDSVITLTGADIPYVSRGGLKLKAAVQNFTIDLSGKVCADIGASTGGFTDCMLQEGAARVYAVDVGYGLIDAGLRADPRVTVIERTNVRHMEPGLFGERVDFAAVDVSFISLALILGPVAAAVKPGGEVVALVKPQFEAGRGHVGKGGIVRDEKARRGAVEEVKKFAVTAGLEVLGEMESPVRGAKGNIEYLLRLRKPQRQG